MNSTSIVPHTPCRKYLPACLDFSHFHKLHACTLKLPIILITVVIVTIMAKTQRNAYDAAFKLKVIHLAVGKGNRAAAQELGLNESIRRWKQQREFSGCVLYSGAL